MVRFTSSGKDLERLCVIGCLVEEATIRFVKTTYPDLAVDQSKNSSGLRNDKEAQSIYAALEMLTTA